MAKLLIQWKHLSVGGKTCQRCSDTGKNITQVLEDLRGDPRFREISFEFEEKELLPKEIEQSNEVLFNGIPIEKFITNAKTGESDCRSCTDLVGQPVKCRTVCCEGEVLEAIPKEVIRQAILNWFNQSDNLKIMENKITKIEVIGSGCANCKKLHELAMAAAKELNINVEIEYSNDIQKALVMGVMQFPVLAVNGKAVLTGQADLGKVKEALSKENKTDNQPGCCPCGGDCGCL